MTIASPSRFVVADIGFAALNRQTVKSLNRHNDYVAASLCRGVRFSAPASSPEENL